MVIICIAAAVVITGAVCLGTIAAAIAAFSQMDLDADVVSK